MWVRLEVEDSPLDPMFGQTKRFERVSTQYESVASQALQYTKPGEEKQLRGRLREHLLTSPFVRGTKLPQRLENELHVWEKMPAKAPKNGLEEAMERLGKARDVLREKRERLKEKEQGDLPEADAKRLNELEFQLEVGRYERALRLYESRFWEAEKDEGRKLVLQSQLYLNVYRSFLSLIEDAFRERQEQVRKQWPALPPVCVNGVDLLTGDDDTVIAAVSQAALANRLDLMNQRAQLVDSWRKIRVASNALLGTFNVQYHYDASSPTGVFHPFSLGGSQTRHQVILDTELPLVRIAQRNAYRATLIAYQQQRRALQQAEDQVLFDVRSQLRQLRASANSYHNVQKRAIELAYIQVDQSLQAFSQPQQPSGPASPQGSVGAPVAGGGGGGDPAALTQQLLGAQNSLLSARNALYNTWIGYLINRISIYRDMGLMQLDPRGVWIDDVATCHCLTSSPGSPGELGEQRPTRLPPSNEPPILKLEELPIPKSVAPPKK
jgi:hypothetical protein